MVDLNERLRELDRFEPPDVWPEVERRGARPPHEGVTSRLRHVGVALLALAIAGAGIFLALRAFVSPGQPAAPSGLSGSDVVDLPGKGETAPAFLADGHPVFVVHHEDGNVGVVDAFSTHRPWGVEELIGWCPSSRTFDEPEHGAKFNEYGQYVAGPAAADLARYEVERIGNRVRVGSAIVPTTRSENPRVGFQGELCGGTGAPITLHPIPRSAVFASPAEAVQAGPEGWIALRGVLFVRRGESALLCATDEQGSCTSPAVVEGIHSEAWLDFLDRSQVSFDSEWIARVEGGHLTSLTRTGLG
jgi:Rieske [2Fe-2S] domain